MKTSEIKNVHNVKPGDRFVLWLSNGRTMHGRWSSGKAVIRICTVTRVTKTRAMWIDGGERSADINLVKPATPLELRSAKRVILRKERERQELLDKIQRRNQETALRRNKNRTLFVRRIVAVYGVRSGTKQQFKRALKIISSLVEAVHCGDV